MNSIYNRSTSTHLHIFLNMGRTGENARKRTRRVFTSAVLGQNYEKSKYEGENVTEISTVIDRDFAPTLRQAKRRKQNKRWFYFRPTIKLRHSAYLIELSGVSTCVKFSSFNTCVR